MPAELVASVEDELVVAGLVPVGDGLSREGCVLRNRVEREHALLDGVHVRDQSVVLAKSSQIIERQPMTGALYLHVLADSVVLDDDRDVDGREHVLGTDTREEQNLGRVCGASG